MVRGVVRSILGPAALAAALVIAPACSRPAGVFSEQNARAHVGMLAGTIGSRPIGTRANASARAYILEQLKQSGFEVRVQETDARRRDLGITARVANIIAVLPGQRPEAIGLLAHYDSVHEAPGAGDDALGVAVALETARVFGARRDRVWSLFVLITDGEESGLMGAAALVDERSVTDRLRAYLNVEAIGSAGVPVLFETGPGNGWLTAAWARHAPHPRGGSYAVEIYKRLPNDTDFSILQTRGIPGLNFAAVGDSYAYHTARDTADRLSPRTIRTMGENAVAIVDALQTQDITARTGDDRTFFDVAGTVGVSYGPAASIAIAAAAFLAGLLAWLRVARALTRAIGVWRWLLLALWTAAGVTVVAAAMVGAVWLLRAAREVYHPWYAHPGRMVALLIAVGTTAGWAMSRAGRLLPGRGHVDRHAAAAWSVALPAWIVCAAAAVWLAPSAAYLWTLPLLAAGLTLLAAPPLSEGAVRAASVAILAVTGTLWLRESLELVRFVVAVMGRLPIVTPVYVYPAMICAAGLMIVPPFVSAFAPARALRRPSLVTTVLLLCAAVTAGLAYSAPGYTHDRPLRRYARAMQTAPGAPAVWEIGSVEPGIDLGEGAPRGFAPAADDARVGVPWGRLTFPFVFRATAAPLGPPPALVTSFTVSALEQGAEAAITVVPSAPGIILSFVLPPELVPARSNLPGVRRSGQWTARFVAPPPEGVAWRASFSGVSPDALGGIRVVASAPWGLEPPEWLPQDRAVWSGSASWILPAPAAVAPPVPLR